MSFILNHLSLGVGYSILGFFLVVFFLHHAYRAIRYQTIEEFFIEPLVGQKRRVSHGRAAVMRGFVYLTIAIFICYQLFR